MKQFFSIPAEEFANRLKKVQNRMREEDIDVLLAFGNEAEPQFVRYLSDYWPAFETAGVLIPKEGEPILIIGPESMTYASERSMIKKIRRILVFRESSDPEYPGAKLDSFNTVLDEVLNGNKLRSIGIVGWSLIPNTIFQALSNAVKAYGKANIFKADKILTDIKAIKSENELECMREAYRICQQTFKKLLEIIKPGMTEIQVRGLALGIMHELGAESEAYPFWVLCGDGSEQAISRARNKVLTARELIQIQIGVRYAGYVATMGRPIVFGKASQKIKDLINAGLAGQRAVMQAMKEGVIASVVSDAYHAEMERIGYRDWLLYGPCHGTGLMEGEPPWIESNSDWVLKENMTFATCIFLGKHEERMGLRIEDGVRIQKTGLEEFSNYRREIIEL